MFYTPSFLHGLDDIKDYLSSNGFCRNPSIPSIKLYTQYVTQDFLNDLACLVKNNSDLDIPTQNRIHSIKKHILKKQLNTFKEKDYSYRLKLDCLQLLKDIFELADKTGIFLTEASSAGIKERFDLQNEKIELYHFMPEIAQSIGNNFIFPLELLEPEYIENLDKVFNSSDSRKSLFSYHHSEYIYEKRNSQISELGDNKSNIEIVSASPQNH